MTTCPISGIFARSEWRSIRAPWPRPGSRPAAPSGDGAVARSRLELDVRSTILVVAVSGGVALSASTELLSLLGWLTFSSLLASWTMMLATAGVLLARLRGSCGLRRVDRLPPVPQGLDLVMAGWGAIVVALSGAVALFAVPTTWDSMSYHLARVAHWAQNHTVAFYPTHIVRQLYQPPWAE